MRQVNVVLLMIFCKIPGLQLSCPAIDFNSDLSSDLSSQLRSNLMSGLRSSFILTPCIYRPLSRFNNQFTTFPVPPLHPSLSSLLRRLYSSEKPYIIKCSNYTSSSVKICELVSRLRIQYGIVCLHLLTWCWMNWYILELYAGSLTHGILVYMDLLLGIWFVKCSFMFKQ